MQYGFLFFPLNLPHTRGGEPAAPPGKRRENGICPTHVGVNRVQQCYLCFLLCICPTHVGVNRSARLRLTGCRNLPHTRGGEPPTYDVIYRYKKICPTHVGVNRPPG